VAVVGVHDLVIVETDDALLITTRDKAQDVAKVVKHLDERNLEDLL
jgi:mannose-1-phosphate guanylyltransferase